MVCSERLAYCDSLKARIDPQARLSILKIKNEICRLPGYRDTITSKVVYDAVLLGNATSVDEFWSYLKSKGDVQVNSVN